MSIRVCVKGVYSCVCMRMYNRVYEGASIRVYMRGRLFVCVCMRGSIRVYMRGRLRVRMMGSIRVCVCEGGLFVCMRMYNRVYEGASIRVCV